LTADCKDCSSDRYRFFLFLGTGSLERVKVSGSNDSAIPPGFLADWPDTDAVGPFAGGPFAGGPFAGDPFAGDPDAGDPDAVGPEGPADMPSGWGNWGPGSIEPGDRSSDSRLA
jgi:hypothetical protein